MVKSFIDMGHLLIVSGYIFVVIQYYFQDIYMKWDIYKGISLIDIQLQFLMLSSKTSSGLTIDVYKG